METIANTLANGRQDFTDWLRVQAQTNPGRQFDSRNGSVLGSSMTCPIASWLRDQGFRRGHIAVYCTYEDGFADFCPCPAWAERVQELFQRRETGQYVINAKEALAILEIVA